MSSLKKNVIALFLMGALPAVAAAQPAKAGVETPPYELFVTFGDSLADTGNLYVMTNALGLTPALPPSDAPNRTYFNGRFSNGRIGFEYLWDQLRGSNAPLQPFLRLKKVPNKGGVDFAFGGSTSGYFRTLDGTVVPGLRSQVELFLALHRGKLPAKSLFAIVTGSNDYLPLVPGDPPADPVQVVWNIVSSVDRLYTRGARTIMVLNVTDLGALPLVAQASPEDREGLTTLSGLHNMLLEAALTELAATRPSLKLIAVDVNDAIASLPPMNMAVPALEAIVTGWVFPFPVSACLFIDPRTCPNVPTFDVGPGFFFWDAVHPTTTVHEGLATYLAARLRE